MVVANVSRGGRGHLGNATNREGRIGRHRQRPRAPPDDRSVDPRFGTSHKGRDQNHAAYNIAASGDADKRYNAAGVILLLLGR